MEVAATFGPLRPVPAHPIQSLRDGNDYRLRGGITKSGLPSGKEKS